MQEGFPSGLIIKNLSAVEETWVWFLGWENPMEERMFTHSSVLAWRIPWTEEPGSLQSMVSQRVGQTKVTEHTCMCAGNKNLDIVFDPHFLLQPVCHPHWCIQYVIRACLFLCTTPTLLTILAVSTGVSHLDVCSILIIDLPPSIFASVDHLLNGAVTAILSTTKSHIILLFEIPHSV